MIYWLSITKPFSDIWTCFLEIIWYPSLVNKEIPKSVSVILSSSPMGIFILFFANLNENFNFNFDWHSFFLFLSVNDNLWNLNCWYKTLDVVHTFLFFSLQFVIDTITKNKNLSVKIYCWIPSSILIVWSNLLTKRTVSKHIT